MLTNKTFNFEDFGGRFVDKHMDIFFCICLSLVLKKIITCTCADVCTWT